MSHVVLMGDSIFDNGAYVAGGQPLAAQLQQLLGSSWRTSLLAVDGAVTANVVEQVERVPEDATHIFVSAGGNDALWSSGLVQLETISARAAFDHIAAVQRDFRDNYMRMQKAVLALGCNTAFCTIYDSIPNLGHREKAGLSVFNDTIVALATAARCPVLDLRFVCVDAQDYSEFSPIEPSEQGGVKIARAIQQVLLNHSFERRETVIYG